jgi:thiol-disulfide isomerase/thioredoxin
MSKQWMVVTAALAALALGGAALVRYAPPAAVAVGSRAPDFQVVDLATNDTVSILEAYRGHVTLVNIWATWCAPCLQEMPSMEKVYQDLAPRGFRIAAVSIDDGGPDIVRAFGKDLGLTFDLLHDRSMLIQQAYQTTGVPESFLLDPSGMIIKRVIGWHDWSAHANRMLIERLLDEADAESAGG